MSKAKLPFLFFLLITTFAYSLDFTDSEKQFLKSHKVINITLSTHNYPYEYKDISGEFRGINVDILHAICKELNIKPRFISYKKTNSDAELISCFAEKNKNYQYTTKPLYNVELWVLSHPNKDVDTLRYNTIYLLDQDVIQRFIISKHKDKQTHSFENLQNALIAFVNDESSVLIIDNLHLWEANRYLTAAHHSINLNRYEKNLLQYDLSFQNDKKILYTIFAKALYNIERRSLIQDIFNNWEGKTKDSYSFMNNAKYIIALLIITLIILVWVISLFIRYRVFTKKYFDQINSNNFTIDSLKEELGIVKEQLITYENESINVLENINSIALTLDLNGTILYTNNVITKTLGYNPKSLHRTNVRNIIDEEEVHKLLSVIQQQNEAQNIHSNEVTIRSKEGLKKSFLFTTHVKKTNDGSHSINIILQDITDRKSLESSLETYKNHLEDVVRQRTQTLKDSEERFRLILDRSNDGIFLGTAERFILVNQVFCSLTGYSREQFLDNRVQLKEIFGTDSESSKQVVDFFYSQSSVPLIKEIMIYNYKRELVEVEVSLSSVIFNENRVIMVITRDIAEKKRIERERIEHEKLLTVSQMAITANDLINSPLNAISGYAELLDMLHKNQSEMEKNAYLNIAKSINTIERIMKRFTSITQITLKDYKLKDVKMIHLSLDDYMQKLEVGEENDDNE